MIICSVVMQIIDGIACLVPSRGRLIENSQKIPNLILMLESRLPDFP
jgi:hypothetical protein